MKYIPLVILLFATPLFAQAPTMTNIVITPPGVAIATGTTLQMHFSEVFSDGTTKEATPDKWTSSTPATATVSNTGLVTGVAPGVASITATAGSLTTRTNVSIATPAQLQNAQNAMKKK